MARVAGAGERVIEKLGQRGDQEQVGLDHLVDLGRVDIDMGDPLAQGEVLNGDTIVETPTQGQDQIGVAQRIVGRYAPVHPRHAQVIGRIEGHRTQGIEGGGDRHLEALREPAERCRCPGVDDAAASLDHGPLGGREGVEDGVGALGLEWDPWPMTPAGRTRCEAGCELNVLADIDDHRPRAAMLGQHEGLAQHPLEIVDIAHQVIVLRDRPGEADGIDLLEGIAADRVTRHLAGDKDRGHRILVRISNRRGEVGRAGTGGGKCDTNPTARARIAFGGMARPALLAAEHEARYRHAAAHALVQLHVQWDHRAAGVPEDDLDAEVHQDVEEHGSAGRMQADGIVHRDRGIRGVDPQ